MPDIDEILQNQLEAIESGRPVKEVLEGLPGEASDLESLIKLAAAVRDLPHPEFEFEKAQAVHQRVLAASQAITRPVPRRRRSSPGIGLRWLMTPAFATVAAIFLGALVVISAAGVWLAGPPGGRSALVLDVNGRVEASLMDGEPEWRAIYSGDRVYSDERIRTFGASEATLVFYEGSRANIGANADLILETVHARWGKAIEVEIVQNSGKTNHNIIPLRGKNSSYVVQAPGASASVQGTTFEVAVSDNGQSLFAVHTGKVQVSNDRNQVLITAGQATMAQPGQTLEFPAYTFSVAGQMTAATDITWTVAGVTFITNENTSINGNPVIGDDLIVTGRITANNNFIADNIEVALIPQASASFTGVIQSQAEKAWQISDHNVLINEETITTSGLLTGDPVLVTYTVLDGERLAQSIASLDEAAEVIPESATPSPVPGAKPALEFVSEQLESAVCGTNEYTFQGSLVNEGEEEDDFAANVHLGWQIERGASYVKSIELVPDSDGERIEPGEALGFTLNVELNEDWLSASGKDSHVILRVILNQETNRPDHLKSRMTINITACNELAVTDEPTPTKRPVERPTNTPVPRITPDFCTGELIHPTGERLASRYEVEYQDIMEWFCSGYSFGEINLAFTLANQNEIAVADIFEMKEPGKPWGQIKQELFDKVKPTQKPKPDLEELKPTQKPKPEKDKTLPVAIPTKKS